MPLNLYQAATPTSTKSLLRLPASGGDDGATLKCRAESPSLTHLTKEFSTTLSVHCNFMDITYLNVYNVQIYNNYQYVTDLTNVNNMIASVIDVPEAAIIISSGSADENRRHDSVATFSEGDSVTLACHTRANPPTYNITFLFNVNMHYYTCGDMQYYINLSSFHIFIKKI